MEEPRSTVWVSIGRTVNLGDYNSVKIDVGLSGVPYDATDQEIAERMQQANTTIEKITVGLIEELSRRVKEAIG